MRPDLSIENGYSGVVIGVDEAGRGPLAGSVVAGAVILDPSNIPDGINDSKKLSVKKRDSLYNVLIKNAICGIGIASVEEIDEVNILNATYLAMNRAISEVMKQCAEPPTIALIDGNKIPKNCPCPAVSVVKGDTKSLSIAAASIIAKVTRDKMMLELHEKHPEYQWDSNSGYGTKAHREALDKHGITEHHRKTFSPIKEMLMPRLV